MLCVIIVKMRFRGTYRGESRYSDLHWLLLCVLLVRHGAEAVARWVTVPTLRSGEWGECPPAGVRLLAPVSFITATSAHPPAAPSLTWPGQGSSSPWFIYTQGEIWRHTHCHFSWEYPHLHNECMSIVDITVWESNHWFETKPESHWDKSTANGDKLVDYWRE